MKSLKTWYKIILLNFKHRVKVGYKYRYLGETNILWVKGDIYVVTQSDGYVYINSLKDSYQWSYELSAFKRIEIEKLQSWERIK
jgi:hypothetical protein